MRLSASFHSTDGGSSKTLASAYSPQCAGDLVSRDGGEEFSIPLGVDTDTIFRWVNRWSVATFASRKR
jgi:hypothetical protein